MIEKKKDQPKEKSSLHPRNRHRERYDFKQLVKNTPELAPFVSVNIHNDVSIDFFNPDAVKMLNKALLKTYYDIANWDIPAHYLCPPIPGRANYIHHIADLLRESNYGKIPVGKSIKCLDIGVGANCVYPIIGSKEYDWYFVGTDIDPLSIDSANRIVQLNARLKENVVIRFQDNSKNAFRGVIEKDENFDITICNPPFHASFEEAQTGSIRKVSNLQQKKVTAPILNFAGQSNELWCEGGEEKFVNMLITQSKRYANSCFWFSSLISKQSILKRIEESLYKAEAMEVKIIPMGTGNKSTRIIAWTFLNKDLQKNWANSRWNDQKKIGSE